MSSYMSANARKFLTEEICSVCGKSFIPAAMHIYKVARKSDAKVIYQCSYTCFNVEKGRNPKKYSTCNVSQDKVQHGGRKRKVSQEES